MSSTAVLSNVDLNTPHSLFLSGGPRLSPSSSSSSQRRDRDRRSSSPSSWTGGPVYSPSSRFNPFEDETTAGPYTHYYYYDTTTNSPALAFDLKPQPTCNTTTNIPITTSLNLNPSSRRSPSPPSPSSLTSFYPPPTMVENHARRSPSPPSPSHVRRRSGAMSLGSNDLVTQAHHGYHSSYVSSPYVSQPHPSSKGFTPLTIGPTPSTPRLAPRPSPYSYQTPQSQTQTHNNNKKSFGTRGHGGSNRNGHGHTHHSHQATLVSSGRTNPPIERPGSAPPSLAATVNTANATQSPTTRPTPTRSQPLPSPSPSPRSPSPSTSRSTQPQTQTQSSIYTLLSRPLPASSRDTIAGIVASMLLSRADSGSGGASRPRKCNSGSYVKSGLSRVVFVE